MVSTYFGLLSEFETAEIPLSDICEKYFGLKEDKAKQRANLNKLPVPCYRGGSQKSPWLVNAKDLAEHIDKQREKAKNSWNNSNAATANHPLISA